MRNQVKKIVSLMLACLMVVTSVGAWNLQQAYAAESSIKEAAGWYESAYAEWSPVSGATGYNVYVKSASATDAAYVLLDDELIRQYPTYMRADALGLRAGEYVMKIVPLKSGKEDVSSAMVTSKLKVNAYDRSGFTFADGSPAKDGVGAYNNDGTLKTDASVLYVTESNKNTVKLTINGTEYTGVANITQAIKTKNKCQPVAIRFIGQVTLDGLSCKDMKSAYAVGVKEASNVTFEGVGEDATLYEAGVAAFTSSSIEVRNLGFMNWGGGGDGDGITLKKSLGVWVHNNDVFYGNAGSDGDQAKGDGSMDLKDNSQYVTISYNHFWDSGKMSLCGMKSESGENWITYHHNWFDHSDSRHPRIRTMSVHVYNNYYDGNSKYGVGAAKDSEAFVEANYFRHCKYPMLSSMQGSDVIADGIFSSENGGIIKAFNNYIVDADSVIYANSDAGTTKADAVDFDAYLAASRDEIVPSTYKAKQGGSTYSNFDTKVDLGVDPADIDDPLDVPSIVMSNAGRMNGGDFRWTFDNSVDDTSYSLNKELKAALNAYKTTLVSVGGGSASSGTTHKHSYTSTITKQPTATEKGERTYKCSCGDTYTEEIPATGSGSDTGTDNPGTDNPDAPVVSGGYVYTFEDSGTKSSLFTVSGNTSTGKGSVLYNGVTYKTCLKMESSTNISFTAPADGTLTLVFGGSTAAANKGVKINGTAVKCGEDGIVTAKFEKGKTVTVTKKDSINLFYMSYTPDKTDADTPDGPDTTKNGLVCEDDAWKYYKEGKIDTTYVGVVINDLGMWYVSNGTIDWSYTGLAKYGELTCYIKDGAVNSLYTGLVNVSDEWKYVTEGVVNTTYAGIVNNEYGWWYVANGTIDWTYTNLVRVDDAWWYVRNGGIDFGYTGLYENEYGWWYIKDGKVAEEYCGLVNNENGWWYVSYGRIDWEFTGLIENEHGWWYVMNGGIDFTYTGLVENEYGWWYVVNSGIDFSYTGEATNEYGTWNVVDGKVVF